MKRKISEIEMLANLIDNFLELSRVEFVEEYNRQMGADLVVDEVDWDDNEIKYTVGT